MHLTLLVHQVEGEREEGGSAWHCTDAAGLYSSKCISHVHWPCVRCCLQHAPINAAHNAIPFSVQYKKKKPKKLPGCCVASGWGRFQIQSRVWQGSLSLTGGNTFKAKGYAWASVQCPVYTAPKPCQILTQAYAPWAACSSPHSFLIQNYIGVKCCVRKCLGGQEFQII